MCQSAVCRIFTAASLLSVNDVRHVVALIATTRPRLAGIHGPRREGHAHVHGLAEVVLVDELFVEAQARRFGPCAVAQESPYRRSELLRSRPTEHANCGVLDDLLRNLGGLLLCTEQDD